MNRFLVCYDISAPDRLRRVHDLIVGVGTRVQYSVYEAILAPMELELLRHQLTQVMDLKEDQVMFVRLGSDDFDVTRTVSALGRPWKAVDRTHVVV